MQVCSWGMWPGLHSAGCWESPPHHSLSTGHFLSLESRRLAMCVYLPCRCSLNPRLHVVSDAPHSGTRGQTDNMWWSKPRITSQSPSKILMPFSGDISRQMGRYCQSHPSVGINLSLGEILLHSQWAWRSSRNCSCSLEVDEPSKIENVV